MSDERLAGAGRVGPDGEGWKRWSSAAAPEARLWVNEEAREIVIEQAGEKSRIAATDATTFALEVADIERYYDATPPPGGRDSAAMLREPTRTFELGRIEPALRIVLVLGTVLLAVGLLRTVEQRAEAAEAAEARRRRDEMVAVWGDWAEQHGSAALRAAIASSGPMTDLLKRDIGVALVPPAPELEPCSASVQVGEFLDPDERLAPVVRRARAAASKRGFPVGSRVTVGESLWSCRFPDGSARACFGLWLRYGSFEVETCYAWTPDSVGADARGPHRPDNSEGLMPESPIDD
jgi:hypothetical protein